MSDKKAIALFAYDRPEMLQECIRRLMRCPGGADYDWYCFVDGQGLVQKNFYQEDYPDIKFVIREYRVGLNANILLAFRSLFENYKYDFILYVEDDVFVAPDFIRYVEYCHYNFRRDDTFTVSGFGRKFFPEKYKSNQVIKLFWYHPWGNLIHQVDYDLFKEGIDEYIASPFDYMMGLGEQLKVKCPSHYEKEYKNDTVQFGIDNPHLRKIINFTQDCYLNAIRALNYKYQLMPCHSRTQNAGFYGQHQQAQYNGEDLSLPETHRLSCHATDSFYEGYEWESLELLDEIQT